MNVPLHVVGCREFFEPFHRADCTHGLNKESPFTCDIPRTGVTSKSRFRKESVKKISSHFANRTAVHGNCLKRYLLRVTYLINAEIWRDLQTTGEGVTLVDSCDTQRGSLLIRAFG
jgi:hypothetical protein